MSRFSFFEDENARRLATFASDRLLVELERYHRELWDGRIVIRIEVGKGIPSKVVVTPEVTVISSSLVSDSKEE